MIWRGFTVAEDFGEIIAQRRHDIGLTQQGLAEKVGYKSGNSIARIEHGLVVHMVKPRMFWALGRALRLSPGEMLEAAGYLPDKAVVNLSDYKRQRRARG